MNRKKRFGVSQALTQGLNETIQIVENSGGEYRNATLPMSRVEIDPDNPRDLIIGADEIIAGPDKTAPHYARKNKEYTGLVELAESIKASGLIHPILVYKHGQNYRIVAGERRYLASKRLGKEVIEARVFNKPPKGFSRKLAQWFENQTRVGLSLLDRIRNIKDILTTYTEEYGEEPTGGKLSELTGLSRSQCVYYIGLTHAPDDLIKSIEAGKITSVDKAYTIAIIRNVNQRRAMIEAAEKGASMAVLKGKLKKATELKSSEKGKRGRVAIKVNMGSTTEKKVVKFIIDSVLENLESNKVSEIQDIDWNDFAKVSEGFRKLVGILEKTMRGNYAE